MGYDYIGGQATVTIVPGQPPRITSAQADAGAAPNVIVLGVGAEDDGGPAGLTYTWEVVSAPPRGTAQIGLGSDATPGVAAATVTRAGPYTFRVTVRDPDGLTATAEASTVYPAYPATMTVSPRALRSRPAGRSSSRPTSATSSATHCPTCTRSGR